MRYLTLAALALLLAARTVAADDLQRVSTDPVNDKFINEIGTVALAGRSITFLVTRRPQGSQLKYAYLLFPGAPGYGNLGVENGAWRYTLKGNLLVRARRHFTENDALAVVIDAPSDMQGHFPLAFRVSPRYGEDIRAVVTAVERHFGGLDWTFIGTSEGSVSAAHAARLVGDVARRVVLTSSVVSSNKAGIWITSADVAQVKIPVLWVHHEKDPCRATQYTVAKSIAERLNQPLITVSGSEGASGEPCEARSEHGFAGREIATIRAIQAWVRTGEAVTLVDAP